MERNMEGRDKQRNVYRFYHQTQRGILFKFKPIKMSLYQKTTLILHRTDFESDRESDVSLQFIILRD